MHQVLLVLTQKETLTQLKILGMMVLQMIQQIMLHKVQQQAIRIVQTGQLEIIQVLRFLEILQTMQVMVEYHLKQKNQE